MHKRVGCWEAEAAGPALARRGNGKSAEEVITAARKADHAAQNAVAETAGYLAMGVANIVSILNPEMIVLGGGLMQAGDLFIDTIKTRMIAWAQPIAARQVRIELTQLGEDAGLFGAARLALDHLNL
jgi:glucokinase